MKLHEEVVMHRHHIVPKHAGGTDDESNLVTVNVPMHALLHEELYKEHGRSKDKLAATLLRNMETWTPEAIRLRASLGGQVKTGPQTEEHKSNISKAKMGHQHSEDTRNKISESLRGHKATSSTIAKMIEAKAKTWVITTPSGVVETIKNLSKYCDDNGLQMTNMYQVLIGNRKQHKGYSVQRQEA